MTLVELLVVIAIITMLMALLLPAVQSVRETARRARCSNNVKQLTTAALGHVQAQGFFPSGGWGWWWVGDGDRGFGWRQPGGWIYSSLPYLEQLPVFNLPTDGNPISITEPQRQGAVTMVRTPLPTINCPSRRKGILYPKPVDGTYIGRNAGQNPSNDNTVARSCYAANGGHTTSLGLIDWGGPPDGVNLSDPRPAGSNNHNWPDRRTGALDQLTGLAYGCSEVKPDDVADGCSNTYLLGEKYLNPDHYDTGLSGDDNETWVTGTNNDMIRTGGNPPRQDTPGYNASAGLLFGGPHTNAFCMGFADGATRWVRYQIDPSVHRSLSHRSDGAVIPGDALR
jgi:type II secretory pathway pseudopilin PulG